MDETDICDHLQLEALVNAHKTPCRVESCSAALKTNGLKNPKMDESIDEGFCWLLELVDEKWNVLSERVRRDVERKAEKDRKERTERAERVRRSRELREKEEKSNGRLNGEVDGKRDVEVDRDAGDPFKPIKHQLETSLKNVEERKKSREQEIRRNDYGGQASSKPHHESKSMENISWKPPTTSKHILDHDKDSTKRPSARSNHRSDSEEEDTARSRSNRGLDLDDADQRPSARSRSSVDRDRSSTRSKYRADDDDLRLKSTSNRRTDFDEERMETRRLRNWTEPLKPISPTRITGLKNGSDESVTDEDEVDRSGSIYPSRTSKPRIVTPPVPLLRAAEADGYHQKWNGHSTAGNMAAANNDKNTKKKKKARFNQTAPALDSPEPYSSWRNTYSASPDGQRFHPSSTYPDRAEVRMTRTPLLQRLVEAKAENASTLKRRTNLNDDDDDEDIRPRTNTRDTYSNRRPTNYIRAARKPNGHGHRYNSEDDDDDDDDDIIV